MSSLELSKKKKEKEDRPSTEILANQTPKKYSIPKYSLI